MAFPREQGVRLNGLGRRKMRAGKGWTEAQLEIPNEGGVIFAALGVAGLSHFAPRFP